MAKVSLHVAVAKVDSAAYPERFEALPGAMLDAQAMAELAMAEDLKPALLLGPAATAAAVLDALEERARVLEHGDLLFVTFSGHGSVGPDLDHDEDDQYDETLVLHDRQLLDDELWVAWGRFRAGVRIFLVVDSCHSGTAARALRLPVVHRPAAPGPTPPINGGTRSRRLPARARAADFEGRASLYNTVAASTPPTNATDVVASVLLFAACQDVEDALEDDAGGVFTRAFVAAWRAGGIQDYPQLFDETRARVSGQSPNYLPLGAEDPLFESSRPFSA